MAGAITNIKWQWFVLCGALLIVVFVAILTDELSPEALERWSVDAKRWEHSASSAANRVENRASLPPSTPGQLKVFGGAPSKAEEAQEEAAGLGHHVHTFHDSSGDIHATNVKGVLPVQEHRDVQTHLSRPPTEPLEKYSKPHALPEMPPPEVLLSRGAPVTASVRGNLGPASSITDGKNEDWLRDRWQAAKDMTGKPIDGNQWVMLDLSKRAQITRLVLDWETAFAKGYTIEVSDLGCTRHDDMCQDESTGWNLLYHTDNAKGPQDSDSKQHVVHNILVGTDAERDGAPAGGSGGAPMEKLSDDVQTAHQGRFVRITIEQLGTIYGASLWEVRVFGLHV